MSTIQLGIAGCTGRMGQALIKLATAEADFDVVAALTVPGDPLIGIDAGTVAGVDSLEVPIATEHDEPCDVLVEFSTPAGCIAWAAWCSEHGVPLVTGTTGLDDHQQRQLRSVAQRMPIVWAPNMSVGINLMLRLLRELSGCIADWDVEITEAHHRHKIDAPSGTAGALLDVVCQARQQQPDKVAVHGRAGHCGPRRPGEVGVHALRLGSLVGEHEVHFATDAECLSVRHRAFSRDTFAAGALRAARWIQGRPPGLYDMQDVLAG